MYNSLVAGFSRFGGSAADAGSCLPVHGIRERAGGT
jgi:hypothetical protein